MQRIKFRKSEDMNNSGIEWIGDIPLYWEVEALKRIFYDTSGNGFPIHLQGDELGDIPFYKVSDISINSIFVNESVNYVSKKQIRNNNWSIIKPFSILMAKIGEALKKNHRTINMSECLIDNNMLALTNKKGNRQFFYHVMTSIDMSWFTNPGAVPSINMKYLRNVSLPWCNGTEQQKIANFLDTKTAQFDSIISNKELLIKKLEEAKKSLFSEAVTGKVKIVDGKMVPRKPEEMKYSGIEWLGMIPNDWQLKRLKYVMKINPVKSDIKRSSQLCSFVPMNKLHNGIVETDEEKMVNEVYDGYTYFHDGDIIMAKVTPCFENGDIAIASNLTNKIGFGTTEINVFRVNKNYDNAYVYYALQENHFMRYGSSHMTGVAGLKRVPTSYIANSKIAIPDFNEQQRLSIYIETQIEIIRSLRMRIQLQIEKLKQAKQSLIYEAVTGKIDLRDWNIIEEGEVH